MRLVLYILLALCFVNEAAAQTDKIDLSKDPVVQPATPKKTDAELLRSAGDNKPVNTTDANLAEKYKTDVPLNGTYQGVAPNTSIIQGQPQMMNVQQQQGQVGNLKTNSATYYDNSGKIRSSGTTIELGKKK